jgi:hypothetical protein
MFKNQLYYQEMIFMRFIHLIVILITSLCKVIIIVEHLFMWFIHALGGGRAILVLFVHCIIYFALEVMSCI